MRPNLLPVLIILTMAIAVSACARAQPPTYQYDAERIRFLSKAFAPRCLYDCGYETVEAARNHTESHAGKRGTHGR